MTYEVVHITPKYLRFAWPALAPFVQKLANISDGRIVPEQVGLEFLHETKRLWGVYNKDMVAVGFIGVSSSQAGEYLVLNVDYLAGENLPDWAADGERAVIQYAVETGHDFVRFETFRKGWEKMVELFEGVKPVGYIYERDLRDVRRKQDPVTHVTGRKDDDSERS